MKRRVVITGMGAVTPIGNNVNDFWNNAKEGKLGIDYITLLDKDMLEVKIAAEVKNFNPEEFLGRKECKRMDRFTQLALVSADEAIKDSKIDLEKVNKDRFGVMFGSGIGGFSTVENDCTNLVTKSRRMSPFFIPMALINLSAGNIAIRYNLKGPCSSAVTACATGTNNIGDAFRLIKDGYADVMLAGGSEAPITRMAVGGFHSMKALCNSDDPLNACKPFDKNRSGFVMAEGAGSVILEELSHAQERGANIIAEVVGYGSTCDAYHITSPAPDGSGAAKAMKVAIDEAGISEDEISYINAHGTSTHLNDFCETLAIKKVFGDNAYNIPVSSTKSMTGHLLGATGAVEAIICAKALQEGFIPPTIGYETKDEELDLDYVPNVGRSKELKYALSNTLGFGGHNATILLKKWD